MSEDIEKVMNITSDRLSNNEDEQLLQGVSMSEIDPAILMVSESVVQRYSKEELIGIRELPLSKKKPDILDLIDVIPSIFDPEKWNLERKKSDTPPENGKTGDVEHGRRRNGDPRERLKKENDGIVLSPQRRSFNTGCFVPGRETATGRTGNEGGHVAIREIQSGGARRIGSGRIVRESWGDFAEKSDQPDGDFGPPYTRGAAQRGGAPGGGDREDKYDGRGGRDEKYDRRSFGREFDLNRGERGEMTRGGGDRGELKEKEGARKNGRYSERRRFSSTENMSRDDEPEWFSSGPISQHDTIELRGFDDCDKLGQKKKLSASRIKRAKEWSKKKSETQTGISEEKEKEEPNKGRTTPLDSQQQNPVAKSDEQQQNNNKKSDIVNNEQGAAVETERAITEGETSSFNFDDILKCDTIPGLLTNGIGGDADTSKSRFSRWFKKDSPEKLDSRRSSIQDDNHIIKDLLKDINDTSVSIPADSDSYFAPISPAANTGSGGVAKHAGQPISFVEMFQRSQRQTESNLNAAAKQPQMAGKILSLDELEAKMRQKTDVSGNMHHQKSQQKPDEEMTAAFKRMLVQAQGGTQNGPVPKPQAMSLLEMLSHSQQQDEARLAAASNPVASQHLLGAASPNMATPTGVNILHPQHPNAANNDLTLKLQQAQLQKQQMDMLNKFINAGIHTQHQGHLRTSPIHDLGLQQSRELLSRPEAQAILQGLKRGEITTQHLYQQLANPALQPRHRDMLLTILRLQGGGSYGVSPRVLSPVPPPTHHHMYHQQQQQQLRVSPLPPNAMHQRIPSPRELQVHTQNILQRALIKKKLEEQTENYRKKQEMQRGTSPNTQTNPQSGPSKSVSSPTPLAFTPTSVLRKMTADKDEGKENKAVGDASKPAGRPLTGMRPQPQPVAQQWNQQFAIKQPAGRPIVKANPNYQPMQNQTTEQFFNQAQQHLQQVAQQQQRHFTQPLQPPNQQQQQQQQQPRKPPATSAYSMTTSNIPSQGVQQYVNAPYQSNPQPFSQQLTQQQMRAQHQHRPANQTSVGAGSQQAPVATNQSQLPTQAQPQQQGGAWQQFLSNTQQSNRSSSLQQSLARNPLNDGSLSPTTTNQLARWFSPDLLERARGGELPSTAGLAQHALSLEDIERQTAPPVHN